MTLRKGILRLRRNLILLTTIMAILINLRGFKKSIRLRLLLLRKTIISVLIL